MAFILVLAADSCERKEFILYHTYLSTFAYFVSRVNILKGQKHPVKCLKCKCEWLQGYIFKGLLYFLSVVSVI